MIAPLSPPAPFGASRPVNGSHSLRRHAWPLAVLAGVTHWSTALVELAVCAVFVSSLLEIRRRWRTPHGAWSDLLRGRWAVRAAMAFWGVYVLSVCASLVVSGTLMTAHTGLLFHAMLFPAVLIAPLGVRDLRKVGFVYIASGLASIVATVIQNLSAGFSSPAIVFAGLTTFADLTVLLSIVLLVGVTQWKKRERLFSITAGAGVIAVAAVFWTAERAPVVLLAGAGAGVFALTHPRLLTLWGVLTLTCFLLAPPALRARTDWVVRGNSIDRYVVWEEGGRSLAHVPAFGYGPNSFSRLLSVDARARFMNRPPASWHNDLLQTALDSGPIAAAAVAGLIVLAMVAAIRHGWETRWRGFASVSAIPGLLLLCLVVLGLVGSVVTTAILGSVFWCLLGLTMRGYCSGPPALPVGEEFTDRSHLEREP